MDWFKKFFNSFKEKWATWKPIQKIIGIGIIVLIIVAVVVLFSVSSKPNTELLFNSPITDETQRSQILFRLDQDNVKAYVNSDGYISVDSKDIANRYRSILTAEGLVPTNIDAYSLFDVTKWSRTDFDDKVNWQRATTAAVEQHILALGDIQKASVRLVLPEESLFASAQKPTEASVILWAKGGSDVLSDKKKIKGIQRLILRSVEGLKEENISIVDGVTNLEINDFEGMAESDRLSNIEKGQRIIQKLENELGSRILAQLRGTVTEKRVNIPILKIDMDLSEVSQTEHEYFGVTIKPDNPDTSYDDSDIRENLVLSTEIIEKDFTGTGFNPQGPAGVDGQNPPVMSDMSNMIGKTTEKGTKVNNALNERTTNKSKSPTIDRLTVSVNIDGTWERVYDEKGRQVISSTGGIERVYHPIPEEDLKQFTSLVRDAVGYNRKRGDSVTVTNIAFDRTDQFAEEDDAYRKEQQRNRTILMILIGIAVVLIAFIMFRIISREIEKKRRLAEEAALAEQQRKREEALWAAKENGMEVTMSVEERKRAELQENAITMAKEHPEDVAMLLRTWLMEES